MITWDITDRHTGKPVEGYCKSTDVKPTEGIANATCLYEMDTKKIYMFDADTKTWIEQ